MHRLHKSLSPRGPRDASPWQAAWAMIVGTVLEAPNVEKLQTLGDRNFGKFSIFSTLDYSRDGPLCKPEFLRDLLLRPAPVHGDRYQGFSWDAELGKNKALVKAFSELDLDKSPGVVSAFQRARYAPCIIDRTESYFFAKKYYSKIEEKWGCKVWNWKFQWNWKYSTFNWKNCYLRHD